MYGAPYLHRNICWLGPYGSHQDTKTLFVIETLVGLALEAPIKIRNTLFVIETFVGLAIKAPTKIRKPYLSKRRLLDNSLREEIVTSFGPLDNSSSDRPFHSGSTTSNQQQLKIRNAQ